MRVILIAADYHPALVEQSLTAAAADGWKGAGGLMCFEPQAPSAPGPESDAGVPRVTLSDFVNPAGEFSQVRLIKKLSVILASRPRTIVIDGMSKSARYSDFDRHGIRAAEIPALLAKILYWSEAPPTILHFYPGSLKPYYVREWAQLVEYVPTETLHMRGHDIAAIRVNPVWQRALAKRAGFRPLPRLKGLLWRMTVGRLAGVVGRLRGRR